MRTVLDNFNPETDYFREPYPHIITKNALPQDLYNSLAKDFPVEQKIAEYGEVLQHQGLPISKVALDEEQSKFFKTVYAPPARRIR